MENQFGKGPHTVVVRAFFVLAGVGREVIWINTGVMPIVVMSSKVGFGQGGYHGHK